MQIGIVGLPNVGKSTLFNALTKSAAAQVANYPFCTIDPNVGVVEVPDQRLKALSEIYQPEKIIPAIVEFVDIAGLVKGASEGEGLGNKFLANIRECDAIAQVVRVFQNGGITHVNNKVDPADDISVIETELILADLQTMEKKVPNAEKDLRANLKNAKEKLEFYQKLKQFLAEGNRAIYFPDLNEENREWLKECFLLTSKPILYIANLGEDDLISFKEEEYQKKLGLRKEDPVVPICAKLEEDLLAMSESEGKELLEMLGLTATGRAQLIQAAYKTLGLATFLTAGPKEVRAWTYKQGSKAPQCAGVIHTDFEKGFICADIIWWEDLIKARTEAKAKELGLIKMQGKEYVMRDGDVCHFKFNR